MHRQSKPNTEKELLGRLPPTGTHDSFLSSRPSIHDYEMIKPMRLARQISSSVPPAAVQLSSRRKPSKAIQSRRHVRQGSCRAAPRLDRTETFEFVLTDAICK